MKSYNTSNKTEQAMEHPAGQVCEIRKCSRLSCGLRFPNLVETGRSVRCPRCRAETQTLITRTLEREASLTDVGVSDLQLEIVLDNIRSAGNVGAIFRTADGLGVKMLHLAGITATPDHPAVRKTSLGADLSVTWHYSPDALVLVKQLVDEGVTLWALEIGPQADDIGRALAGTHGGRLALVVGNEVCGVDPGILELCERMVSIPMRGKKRSLNVGVAFGIAVYQMLNS